MTTGTTNKRCGCTDPDTKARLNANCPKLHDRSGRWSRTHGSWHLQIELPRTADGKRRPLRHGPYPSQDEAEDVLTTIRTALKVPDPDDTDAQIRVGDLIDETVKAGLPVPEPDKIRALLRLDMTPGNLPTVADYLDRWWETRKGWKRGTRRAYEYHIRLYLKPYLGHYRIDKLRARHIEAMFAAMSERNEFVAAGCPGLDPWTDRRTVRYVGITTMHRIRATLRSALNDAMRVDRIITVNEAALLKMDSAKRPRAQVWTKPRVKAWQETGKVPSPVMVWTPAHAGAFLDHVEAVDDRLYALYHLIVYTGLRRGEACGVRWSDIDLDERTLTVAWQLIQQGWAVEEDTPKTDESANMIAIDPGTVAALRAHRARQNRERLAAGPAWIDTGYAFTTPNGAALHPANVTDRFHTLAAEAGLPPIRLHDLRHGNATMALAAGVSIMEISGNLRHSSPSFTGATYTHILDEVRHSAAARTAAVVPRHRRTAGAL